MVSAWSNDNGMVLGQLKVNDKSNEITAIPALLDLLMVKGCWITIDTMSCQKEIAAKLKSKCVIVNVTGTGHFVGISIDSLLNKIIPGNTIRYSRHIN